MPNNAILRDVAMTGSAVALSSTKSLFTGSIGAPTTNSANITIASLPDAPNTKTLIPGEWYDIEQIDLSTIEATGQVGDRVDVGGRNA